MIGGTLEIKLQAYASKGKLVAGIYLDYYLNMYVVCKYVPIGPLQTQDFTNVAFWTVDN
ncbi:hypothetical protein GCM10008119_33900 [Pedobacter mendelii]|uniref:Uncharacterized protein n=1 Tax=Pedobacter mendelii TaxID=1908240 RepID=A0ABQ2BKX0_9SPHI|nr:hypothetical protein GCM10008119_33900 [Pedobacter mendelii]